MQKFKTEGIKSRNEIPGNMRHLYAHRTNTKSKFINACADKGPGTFVITEKHIVIKKNCMSPPACN